MKDTKVLIKIISAFIIVALIFPFSAQADVLNTKNVGKLTMVAVLSVTAFFVKKLVDRDINKTVMIRKELSTPDRYVEFQQGFDSWRVEWHGENIYVFRNGIFSHKMNIATDFMMGL
jgi:hypothetical protein